MLQEDRSVLARLSNLSDAEVELYGPLPPAHKKRRRATIGSGCHPALVTIITQ